MDEGRIPKGKEEVYTYPQQQHNTRGTDTAAHLHLPLLPILNPIRSHMRAMGQQTNHLKPPHHSVMTCTTRGCTNLVPTQSPPPTSHSEQTYMRDMAHHPSPPWLPHHMMTMTMTSCPTVGIRHPPDTTPYPP